MADIHITPFDLNKADADDVVAIATDTDRLCQHADQACRPQHYEKNVVSGLHDLDTIPDMYQSNVYQYKFQRISKTEIERIELRNPVNRRVFSNDPDPIDGQRMDVQRYVSDRIKSRKHRIFGTTGNEHWYGGRQSRDNIDTIWTELPPRSALLPSGHRFKNQDKEDSKFYRPLPWETRKKLILPIHSPEPQWANTVAGTSDYEGVMFDDDGSTILDPDTGLPQRENLVYLYHAFKAEWKDILPGFIVDKALNPWEQVNIIRIWDRLDVEPLIFSKG